MFVYAVSNNNNRPNNNNNNNNNRPNSSKTSIAYNSSLCNLFLKLSYDRLTLSLITIIIIIIIKLSH